ncbi:GntR family transcriptional regulator [Variovorax ginsengisoli]|uniref:GntR family transcriptional regulator n=1 Tax=Variovorax ginsengisoli TaxID=363844 RepID=UPI003455CB1C
MSIPSSHSSITHSIYQVLRADLLKGRYAPDDKLKIADLGDALCVSSGVIREALSRLSAEGLVVAEPQRGFRVAPVSASEFVDLASARIELEGICLRKAIELGNVEWESRIMFALHRLKRLSTIGPAESEDVLAATDAHSDFHRALIDACGSDWLLRARDLLFTHSERYRWLSLLHANRERDLNSEHEELANAVVERRTELACELLGAHLNRTVDYLLSTDFLR